MKRHDIESRVSSGDVVVVVVVVVVVGAQGDEV
jgi:hypothetical protein